MRIAILLVGFYRSYNYCKHHFKKLNKCFKNKEIDYFIHSYDNMKEQEDGDFEQIITYENFKDLNVEEENVVLEHLADISKNKDFEGSKRIIRKWYLGFNLIKNYENKKGFEYDYVLISRPDVIIKGFNIFEEELKDTVWNNENMWGGGYPSEWSVFGSRNNIEKIVNEYEKKCKSDENVTCPHQVLRISCIVNNLKLEDCLLCFIARDVNLFKKHRNIHMGNIFVDGEDIIDIYDLVKEVIDD